MAELSSLATQNSGPAGTIDTREMSMHIGGLVYPHTSLLKAKSGFRPGAGSSPGVVTATGTPDGFVHVAPFQLVLQNGRGSGFGAYLAALDAIKDINILSTPADPTNPRNDLIIAQQSDIFDSDANSDFIVKQVVGTPAVSPSDPSVSGSTNYVTLARVRVDANATTIVSGKITDLRTTGHAKSLSGGLYTVGLGGLLPVASQAERDALTGVYAGMQIWRTDQNYSEIYSGTAWTIQGLNADGINNACGVGSTTSATYVDFPATSSFSLTKIYAGTRLRVDVKVGAYANANVAATRMGVRIAGTDYDIAHFAFSEANVYRAWSGSRFIPGIAAGAQTLQLRWYRFSGTGTLTSDGNSWLSFEAFECR
jgi:hypothetical protein